MGSGQSSDGRNSDDGISNTYASSTPSYEAATGSVSQAIFGDDLEANESLTSVFGAHHFIWAHGGRDVYLTGTFNGWREKIVMTKQQHPENPSQEIFETVLSLSPGYYEYKFIVDNQWRFAPDQPTTSDVVGNINNFIDIPRPFQTKEERDTSNSINENYGKYVCDAEEFIKEPPELPQLFHYQALPLNQPRPLPPPPVFLSSTLNPKNSTSSPPLLSSQLFYQYSQQHELLRSPSHVLVNHSMYGSRLITTATINNPITTAKIDEVLRVAATYRFREKFVTTILLKPMPERQKQLQLYAISQQLQQQQLQQQQQQQLQ